MTQVIGWDGGTRLLLFTRSTAPGPERPLVAYGRILDLATMRVWPGTAPGLNPRPHRPLAAAQHPIPADRLLAMARVQPLR